MCNCTICPWPTPCEHTRPISPAIYTGSPLKAHCPPRGLEGKAGGRPAGPLLCCQGKQGGRIAQEHRLGCVNIPPPPPPSPLPLSIPLSPPSSPTPLSSHTHTFHAAKNSHFSSSCEGCSSVSLEAFSSLFQTPSVSSPLRPPVSSQTAANQRPVNSQDRVRVAGSCPESSAFTHFKNTQTHTQTGIFFPSLDPGPSTVPSSHASVSSLC